jgi:hypothetical protein
MEIPLEIFSKLRFIDARAFDQRSFNLALISDVQPIKVVKRRSRGGLRTLSLPGIKGRVTGRLYKV